MRHPWAEAEGPASLAPFVARIVLGADSGVCCAALGQEAVASQVLSAEALAWRRASEEGKGPPV